MIYATKEIQQALKAKNFDPGPIDGIPGRLTRAAVIAFQKANNLVADGIVGPKTSAKLFSRGAGEAEVPWLALARQKIGLHETINHKTLSDWLKSDGNTLGDPAKLPWCGDFVETCLALTLPKESLPGNPYWALNWSTWGRKASLWAGGIASFTRSGGGHVGFLVGWEPGFYHILGGNQSNAVSIVKMQASRLADIRWPMTYPPPEGVLQPGSINATVSQNEL